MARKPFATSLDADILKQLKLQAIQEDLLINELLEKIILEYLKKAE